MARHAGESEGQERQHPRRQGRHRDDVADHDDEGVDPIGVARLERVACRKVGRDGRAPQVDVAAGADADSGASILVTSPQVGREEETAAARGELADEDVVPAVATWWTALVETAVAVFFLLPRRLAAARWRDPLLLFFCWMTYPFATIAGFGWLLTILGIAQLEPERRRVRLLYLATFGLILIDQLVPWTRALAGLVG